MKLKYKPFWRKTGLKGKWGDIYLEHLDKYKPKNFLEIGVFCGVTARNTCEYLKSINGSNFSYTGIDLFGEEKSTTNDEIEPRFLEKQKFSNPLKNIYYNLILRENINSIESVKKFFKKFDSNVSLIKGDTNDILKTIDLSKIDFVFLDGGHSYQTVKNDLLNLYNSLKDKNKILLCDDYGESSLISEVKRAIDDFVNENKLEIKVIKNRFAEIIT